MRISRPWPTVPVVLSMCLLLWTLLSAHAHLKADMQELNEGQPNSKPQAGRRMAGDEFRASENKDSQANRSGVRADRNHDNQGRSSGGTGLMPYGISVVNLIDASRVGKLFDTSNPTLNAYTNPNTSGITFRTSWADVEPEEGRFDFSKIDTVLASAEKNGKWIRLILVPGFGTPAWALEGVKTEQFPIQYGPGQGTVMSLPMPWDSVYLNRWFAVLKQLSDRYGKSPALRMVAATGPTSVSDEFTLPNSPQDLEKWQNDFYTPSKWIGAWRKVFQVYAADFPNQYISLSFGGGLSINDQGKIDARERLRTRLAIINEANRILGRRFALQYCNLDGIPNHDLPQTNLLISYNGRIVTGFMMRTSAVHQNPNGPGMGAPGDPPLALRRSIDNGMRRNNAGQRINYLEIYEPDVLADEMQPVLHYGASLFPPQQQRSESRAGHEVAGEESRPSENQDSGASRPGPACASTDDSAPGGLVVVLQNKPQNDRSLDLRALSNPCISGVALQIHWGDIERVEGKPDWSKLDELFAAAEKSKKWVQLLIFPGFFSPAWALEGVKTEQFPIQYGPGKGTVLSLPMPWNKVYLDRWFAFLKQLSERYGKSPAFRLIGAAGPTSVSVEMTLPGLPKNLKTWQDDSYTPSKYIAAWQRVLQVYAADFPNQCISLSVGIGLNINDQGRRDPGEGVRTRQKIIDQAIGLLGRRFVLQNSDLSAGPVEHRATSFVMGYSGRIITGLQLRTSAERNSGDMGAEGDPPLALRKSIDKGMEPNDAGQHINYLEIYEPDVLADDMQPVLQYGASLFARK